MICMKEWKHLVVVTEKKKFGKKGLFGQFSSKLSDCSLNNALRLLRKYLLVEYYTTSCGSEHSGQSVPKTFPLTGS